MGEVFLAYDPSCGRNIALKKMRGKWADNPTMKSRFLREARVASQLTHPSIIPIYAIEEGFYTMPYIEGETLKEILKITAKQAQSGEPLHPVGHSIPALVRLFLNICGAVAYTHNQGILHRDLKPDNIVIGTFSEVIILDWGLAHYMAEPEQSKDEPPQKKSSALTLPGKVAGTLLYMSPERAFGKKSTVAADIYSLGVILYQMLTLQLPYRRKTIKEFRKMFKHELIFQPEDIAPDREISPHLSSIAMRCLERNPKDRFKTVRDLIRETENYIEGILQWQDTRFLDPRNKSDWEFQENIPLSPHKALTRGIDLMQWFNLMVSKFQFTGNIKIELNLRLNTDSGGIGLLFCIPENELHRGMEEGYCVWIGRQEVRLYRSNVEVFRYPDFSFDPKVTYRIRVALIDNHVRFFIDNIQKFGFTSFTSHLSLAGTRVGLLTQDTNFTMTNFNVSTGSQNILVNCLAIPDSFLAREQYDEALAEYRKISHAFPGRAEGRESIYRAGLTLLKKADSRKKKTERERFYNEAFSEFDKLHNTPGAPLQYLGKSLIYKAQEEYEEEAKCLELALRKYPKHPLKLLLQEHLLSRLHEVSQQNRRLSLRFALILLQHLPQLEEAKFIRSLLEQSLERLPFFTPSENKQSDLIIQLAFWLNKPYVLFEQLEKGLDNLDQQNANIALMLLGSEDLADKQALKKNSAAQFEYALKSQSKLPSGPYPLWNALIAREWRAAKEIIDSLPKEWLHDESDTHFFLYGCYLAHEKGKNAAIDHLTGITEKSFPPTTTLLSHFLMGLIDVEGGWIDSAFVYEELKLFQQLELFHNCLG